MPTRFPTRAAIATLIALCPLTLPSAASAITWSAPVRVSTPVATSDGLRDTEISRGGDGSLTAVWMERADGQSVIRAATRLTADGAWSAPTDVSEPSDYVDHTARELSVATSAKGLTVIVWRAGTGALLSATRNPGTTTWVVDPDPLYPAGADMPIVKIAPDGRAVVVWINGSSAIRGAYRSASPDGTWAGPWTTTWAADINETDTKPELVIDRFGNATAFAERLSMDGPSVGTWRLTPTDEQWQPGVSIETPGLHVDGFSAIAAPNGDVIAAWNQDGHDLRTAARSAATDLWGPASTIAAGDTLVFPAELAQDTAGVVTTMWTSLNNPARGTPYNAMAARRNLAGDWSAPAFLAPSDEITAWAKPFLNADGTTTALFIETPAPLPQEGYPPFGVQAATTDGDGTFGAPQTIGADVIGLPSFAADNAGAAAAVGFGAATDGGYAVFVVDAIAATPARSAEQPAARAEEAPAVEQTPPLQFAPKPPKLIINTAVSLKRGSVCAGRVMASTKFGGGTLTLKKGVRRGKKTCFARGTFTVTAGSGPVRVTLKAKGITARTISALRSA